MSEMPFGPSLRGERVRGEGALAEEGEGADGRAARPGEHVRQLGRVALQRLIH